MALLQCFLSGFIKQGTDVYKKDVTSLERFRFCSVSSMPRSAIPEEQSSRLGHLLQICSAVHLKCPARSFFTQGSQDHYSDIAYIPLYSPLEYLSIFIAVAFTSLLDILISAPWPETSVRTSSWFCVVSLHVRSHCVNFFPPLCIASRTSEAWKGLLH